MARLTEIFRQAGESRIIVNAHRVNAGADAGPRSRPTATVDFYFVEAADAEDAARKVVEVVPIASRPRFGLDPDPRHPGALPDEPRRAGRPGAQPRPPGGAQPRRRTGAVVERFGFTYRIGDKVMQTENDYDKEVFNGDIGFVATIDHEEGR